MLAAAALVLGLALYEHFITGFYGDKQWEMVCSQMWLAGGNLYTDIVLVSPPLIVWLYALPAKLSAVTGITDAYRMLELCGLCLIGCVLYVCSRLVALHPAFAANRQRQTEFTVLLCFVLIVRTTPLYFLDREHLFFVFTFPYLMRYMPSLARASLPSWLRGFIAALAGVGFCIKPHCLIVFAGIQLLTMVRERSLKIAWSIENLIIYSMGLLYLSLVWWLTPEYFHLVMPMAFATYSAARDENPIWYYAANACWTLIIAFAMFRPRYRSPLRSDIYYLLGLCPFFLLYALLNNNWAYTYYPLSSISLVITGFLLWEYLFLSRQYNTRRLPGWRFWSAAIACLGCFTFRMAMFMYYEIIISLIMGVFIAWELFHLFRQDRQRNFSRWSLWAGASLCILSLAFRLLLSLNYTYLTYEDPCHHNIRCNNDYSFTALVQTPEQTLSFGTISIDYSRWGRLVEYTGARWTTRFPQLWMLPGLLQDEDSPKSGSERWIKDYVAQALASDLNKHRPDIVFVDDTDQFYSVHRYVDLVAFFSYDSSFREAWSHYTLLQQLRFCPRHDASGHAGSRIKCSYDVYRRAR